MTTLTPPRDRFLFKPNSLDYHLILTKLYGYSLLMSLSELASPLPTRAERARHLASIFGKLSLPSRAAARWQKRCSGRASPTRRLHPDVQSGMTPGRHVKLCGLVPAMEPAGRHELSRGQARHGP